MSNHKVSRPSWLMGWCDYPHGSLCEKQARELSSYAVTLESDLAAAREKIAELETKLHRWNGVMSTVAAGSEFHDSPETYVRRFREHSDAMIFAVKQRKEADDKIAELEASFNLRWGADMRAIKRWQEATGNTLVWPDHADLCVWLMEKVGS